MMSASPSLAMLKPHASSNAMSSSKSIAPKTPKTMTALIATGQNSVRYVPNAARRMCVGRRFSAT
jgi:hypothetical protein